jgi:L-lactate utilization protein LutB
VTPPAQRVTEEAVAAWLDDMRGRGNGDFTIVGRLNELRGAMAVLAPGLDVGWLTRPGGVPIRARLPMRRRALTVHHPRAMFDWGLALIEQAKGLSGDDRRRVMLRDGVMITLLGIEKILPKLEDLALFLPLLATAGAGQTVTGYNTLYGGPRQPGESDGPVEWHVVLLDNRRTELLADPEQRDALHCIRCGACLNVCPIFRNVGGHTYGTTYSGPVGSVITPHLRGLQDWKHLSNASSLCGACTEACPVKIDLHHHLLQNRRNAVGETPSWIERLAWRAHAFVINTPALYQFGQEVARSVEPLRLRLQGTPLDPVRSWTRTRDLPPVAPESFKEWWRNRR